MLFAHKSELLFLEHARVYQEGGRIIYAQDETMSPQRFNFPFEQLKGFAEEVSK